MPASSAGNHSQSRSLTKCRTFELGSDIYHFSFASQVLTRLTQNRVRDRYPTFAPDGKRIYFESIDEDPNFPRSLGVSVIASVKTP